MKEIQHDPAFPDDGNIFQSGPDVLIPVKESDTPRTDAAELIRNRINKDAAGLDMIVSSDFARKLERELDAEKRARQELWGTFAKREKALIKRVEEEKAREQKLYNALKRITQYQQPERLRRDSEELYGLSGDDAIAMAYENVLGEASAAIKGMRRLDTNYPRFIAPVALNADVSDRQHEGTKP